MAGLEFPQLARDDEFHRNQRSFPRRNSEYVGFIFYSASVNEIPALFYSLNARITHVACIVCTYTHKIDIFVFVKYYIIIRAGMSKHKRIRTRHVGPACSVEEEKFVPARKNVVFF